MIVEAQMCPSTSKFIRIVAFDDNNKIIQVSAVQVPPQFFSGTDEDCPDKSITAKLIEFDVNTGVVRPVKLIVEKGALGNPDIILNEEEVKLFREKGIVAPPKNINPNPENIKPIPIIPNKRQLTAGILLLLHHANAKEMIISN
jgi:hypothetical protein